MASTATWRVEQSHVDMLAFASAVAVDEGREHADRRIDAGEDIGEGDADLDCGPPPGRPSGWPVIDMMPPMPWIMKS